MRERIQAILSSSASPKEKWHEISAHILQPDDDFSDHLKLYKEIYGDDRLAPGWVAKNPSSTNLGRMFPGLSMEEIHRISVDEPQKWWLMISEQLQLTFEVSPSQILDLSKGAAEACWFPGSRMNIATSCFLGRPGEQTALIRQKEGGKLEHISLQELHERSRKVSRALLDAGFSVGDAIAIDMPMTAEAVYIYLGIVLMGGVVVSIADSFAAPEIQTRLNISQAKGIFCQDVILRGGKELPLYQRVVDAQAPMAIVLSAQDSSLAELRDGDIWWDEFLTSVMATDDDLVHIADAYEQTNILFSSGTTGEPKAIPWNHLTPIKAAADGWAHHDIQRGHVVAWPTNLGWMMGPWLIYAALLNNAAMALYEGIPSGRGFARFVQDASVTMLGVVPSLVRAWRARDVIRGLDWSAIRCFGSTGEASSAEDMLWLMSRAGYKPVIEYCGGTEIGGGYITGSLIQDQVPSAFSTPAIGNSFYLLNEKGQPASEGELALIAPMLGSSWTLLNRDHHDVYFAGMPEGPKQEMLRRHGDQISFAQGYWRAQGRVDDTMNLGGVKTSSAELERACSVITDISEVAAIAYNPPSGGPSQLVLVVVVGNVKVLAGEIQGMAQQAIRRHLNPLFKVSDVWIVDALPRTASNKVMRRVLRVQYPKSQS